MLGIPPLEIPSSVRLATPTGRFWTEYSARFVFDQRRVASSLLERPSPGFTLRTVGVGAALTSNLTRHAGVENLGDKRYFEHVNSLDPVRATACARARKESVLRSHGRLVDAAAIR